MSSFKQRLMILAPAAGSVAITALLGAALLSGPLTPAHADPAPLHATQIAAAPAGETVEQRITNLHASLKVTPAEEANWNGVAQAMRENAAAMEKLTADKTLHPPQNLTALDDLKNYEKFAQAHVDGLKNLISSFETFYNSLPDPQKKIADQVFQNAGSKGHSAHG
ncbi:MAG TPA: Spy/CpxP family protein refolding chaperone [Aliidongia sp.]|nr:Spy/CpxP family protein refolding chaperone [Aliidongia sp.]